MLDETAGLAEHDFCIIDTSTPQSLERDFYAWLKGELTPSTTPGFSEVSSPSWLSSTPSSVSFPPDDVSEQNSPTDAKPFIYEYNCKTEFVDQNYCEMSESPDFYNNSLVYHSNRNSGTNQLGRTYNPGLPLGMDERKKIVALFQKGWKICNISKKLCVTHSCVSKILNRYRSTGSVKPKDAKEGRTESPLVAAIRIYVQKYGVTKQSEIRDRLIGDGICTVETLPSRSSINHILRTKLSVKATRRGASGILQCTQSV
ncbi:unnamed protein product [Bursaphelenchus xylophilus]|uniref:(pine wood nematode) hypothetical protein n=1 Tax=Bursaphelenchus xylophilus TaxID=6326 RepID=A0A1I7RKD3_BURXY|nr:unnamed protein product [Bursaphelenchus xylophilus]CAG9131374.1 unnamed protein product [Bursaphelenchus xylophilus]